MKRLPPLVVLAVLVFAIAWFLQVHKNGATLSRGTLPGWEAFSGALDIHGEDNPLLSRNALIPRISACTNFLMLLALILLLARPGQRPAAWLPVAFDVATVVNLWWLTDMGRRDLRAGYWLWMGSFAIMAIALYVARKPAKV